MAGHARTLRVNYTIGCETTFDYFRIHVSNPIPGASNLVLSTSGQHTETVAYSVMAPGDQTLTFFYHKDYWITVQPDTATINWIEWENDDGTFTREVFRGGQARFGLLMGEWVCPPTLDPNDPSIIHSTNHAEPSRSTGTYSFSTSGTASLCPLLYAARIRLQGETEWGALWSGASTLEMASDFDIEPGTYELQVGVYRQEGETTDDAVWSETRTFVVASRLLDIDFTWTPKVPEVLRSVRFKAIATIDPGCL